MRAIFSGSISFGLVNIPIKIYPATETKKVSFHNLCNKCNSPLQHKRWCPKCEREVGWNEIKKGYKITKDHFVIIEKEELKKIKPTSSKNLEIVQFVDVSQIDPIFFEKSYYLVPNEGGEKAYALFSEALRISNKAAIGKIIMKEKQYIVALRSYKKGIVMHVLHYLGEIREIEKLPEMEKMVLIVNQEELKLAQTLINNLTADFDPKKFKDEYSDAILEMIKSKYEGHEVKFEKQEVKAEEAKSLMEALKASVEEIKKKKK